MLPHTDMVCVSWEPTFREPIAPAPRIETTRLSNLDQVPDGSGSLLAKAKSLGPLTLGCMVVANMVGAGIFTSSGFSLGALGNPDRVMFAWIICGIWAICGAVGYGSLVARLPESGGEYLFLARLVHPSIGFMAGWISVFAGFTAPISVAALTAATYAHPSAASGDTSLLVIASGVIVFAAICHLIGISLGASVQNAIVGLKLLLLLILLGWAFGFTESDSWLGGALPDTDPSWLPGNQQDWLAFVGSMSWITLSYTGFNAAIYVAGESADARRNVPLAMLIATLLVTLFYLSLNIVFVYAPAPDTIANQEQIATIAATAIGGDSLASLLRYTIILSMVSSAFAMLLAGPRVYQKMAEDGVMPRIFSHGNKRNGAFWATILQAGLSLAAIFVAGLLPLLKYLGLTLSACGALAVLSLWWVQRKLPDAKPLRIWEIACLIVYVGISFAIIAASYTTHRDEFFAMLYTFGLGILVYFGWNLANPNQQSGNQDS